MMLAAIGVGDQHLAPVFQPAHRIAEMPREPGQADFLSRKDRLVAEAAADILRDHADVDLGDAEELRQPGADHVRKLGGAVQRQLIEPRLPLRDEAAALDRRHHVTCGAHLARDLHRRVLGSRLDRTVKAGLDRDVALDVVVHQRTARLLRLEHVDDRRQLFVFDDDLGGDVLGLRARIGDAHGDQLADVADPIDDERRLLRHLEARQRRHRPDRLHPGQVLRDENRGAQTLRNVHAGQPRVRDRAADERDLAHAREPDVTDELAAAVQKPVIFLAPEPHAHPGFRAGFGSGLGSRSALGQRQAPADG